MLGGGRERERERKKKESDRRRREQERERARERASERDDTGDMDDARETPYGDGDITRGGRKLP